MSGDDYLASLSYSASHIWRNVGILFAWWVLFVALTIGFTLRWRDAGEAGTNLVIPREHVKKHAAVTVAKDEESQSSGKKSHTSSEVSATNNNDVDQQLVRNTSVFTWRNLTYTVKTPSGDRVLLDNVHGYVKPGMLGALMGSSGAGKTTRESPLINVSQSSAC